MDHELPTAALPVLPALPALPAAPALPVFTSADISLGAFLANHQPDIHPDLYCHEQLALPTLDVDADTPATSHQPYQFFDTRNNSNNIIKLQTDPPVTPPPSTTSLPLSPHSTPKKLSLPPPVAVRTPPATSTAHAARSKKRRRPVSPRRRRTAVKPCAVPSPVTGSSEVTPQQDGKRALQIVPVDPDHGRALQAAGMNPRILLDVRGSKTMRSVAAHLDDKWWGTETEFGRAWRSLELQTQNGTPVPSTVTVDGLYTSQPRRKTPRLFYKLIPISVPENVLTAVDINAIQTSPASTPRKSSSGTCYCPPSDLSKQFDVELPPHADSVFQDLADDPSTKQYVVSGVVDCFDVAVDGFPQGPTGLQTPVSKKSAIPPSSRAFQTIFKNCD